MKRDKDIRGKLAVVTGASSGIGLCFSRELAGRGCNLLMVSNQRQELETCASEISAKHGVAAYTLHIDLTAPGASEEITGWLDRNRLVADYLINNAGIFSFQPVADMPQHKIDCFIRLHVDAVTNISRTFALRFKERGSGRILNMSSMSCWMPMPGIALYSATKAYIRAFSRAYRVEMKDSGVSVTVACPGGIATSLFGLPERWLRFATRIGVLAPPGLFVRRALRRMFRRRAQYVNGLLNRISIVFVALLPEAVRRQIAIRIPVPE